MLDIHSKHLQPDIVVVEIRGRIKIGKECERLEEAVSTLVRDARKKVIIDLTGVTHIDSMGIREIVMAASHMKKAGGELRLAGANGHVEHILKMTHLDQIVGLRPTTELAAAGF